MTLLKLLLVPTAVWLASLAARRWGHAVSGYLGGMPLIGGPITLYLALDPGPEFAARSATLTLAAILGQAAHLLAFAHTARWGRWPVSLLAGWSAYALVAFAIAPLPLTAWSALALAVAGLQLAWIALPRVHGVATVPSIPPVELWLRLGAALALAVVILWSANVFGPIVSGILLSLPVTGSIMPPFTLSLYGTAALARLLRGFVLGLTGFTAFFFTVASTVATWGVALSFGVAVIVALATVSIATRVRPVQ